MLQSFNRPGTLEQRVGNRIWSAPGAAGGGTSGMDGAIETNGLWARIDASHSSIEPETSASAADYDSDIWRMQIGADGLVYEGGGGRLIAGLTAQYGTISADIGSPVGDGKISSTGYGIGGTLTWYGNGGFYLDGQAQATWYDSDLSSRSANVGLVDGNDGFGYAFSIETGKKLEMASGWSVTPQAQLLYSDVDYDRFTDSFGADISLVDADSLLGRVGIASGYDSERKDGAGKTTRSHFYGIANLYYEFLDGARTEVSGTALRNESEELWAGTGVGGTYNWNDDQYSVYGEALINTSLEHFGDSYAIAGTVGFRVKW